MKMNTSQALCGLFLTIGCTGIGATGFTEVQVTDPGYSDLTVGIWYPSDQPAPEDVNTEFEMAMAIDAPMSDTNGGLILLSHGFGGWYAGHADTAQALADKGFVVAAPSHTGNTWSDMSSDIEQWALDRPRHISRVIDHVLGDKQFKNHVDDEKIGVYGFSAGGYTALGLIGGVPDLDHAMRYCDEHPEEFVCDDGMVQSMRDAGMHELPATAWGADERIKAASIAAPGFGFSYTADSLSEVVADVQLWSGDLDVRVPTQSNAAWLAGQLPDSPETHWIDKANHFAFMIVACREAFKQADPEEYELVCGDADGFDRRTFHDDMHAEMARFFETSLKIDFFRQ